MADLFDDEADDSSSDFAAMFENSVKGIEKKLKVGDKVKGEVLTIGKEEVFVTTGTVDDGIVLKLELMDKEGKIPCKVGDILDLFVVQIKEGQTFLSPKATSKNMADGLEDAFNMGLPIEGKVTEVVNGGFRVNIMGKTAFCPISHIDSRRVEDAQSYIGRKLEFMITQFDSRGRNIVVSRRKLLDDQKELSATSFAENHKIGDALTGVVTRMEKFGAFVEMAPGLEGLVHISEIAWSRLNDPSEALKLGDEVSAKILKIEQVGGRMNVSLSIKQATAQPWENMPAEIAEGKIVEGRVTRCMKFGAFVELVPGIEGLVPLSEMSYTKRVMRAEDVVTEGERVMVLIKEIRLDERRLSLSIRDAGGDPWAMVPMKFPEGAVVRGRIERREPYGLFVKLDEGIVALLPKSKAMENPEFQFDKVKIGDEVTVQVAEVKMTERRISLGIPQDPDAEIWRGMVSGPGSTQTKSLGTFADQFKGLMDGTGKKK
jgi:small subunit ribosomal protein S1